MLRSTNSKCNTQMYMNLKSWPWIYMCFSSLTLAAFSVHWKSTECIIQKHKKMLRANCRQLCAHPLLPCLHVRAHRLHLHSWISADARARIWNGLWYNEDLDLLQPRSPPPITPPTPSTTTTHSNQHWCSELDCLEAYWCFVFSPSAAATSSANKRVFEWSYSCLADGNGNCWSRRNSMGDKADRPPQLIWKTARSPQQERVLRRYWISS